MIVEPETEDAEIIKLLNDDDLILSIVRDLPPADDNEETDLASLTDQASATEAEGEPTEQELDLSAGTDASTDLDTLTLYFQKHCRHALLTREEETTLARRYERGRVRALRSLARSAVALNELLLMGREFQAGALPLRLILNYPDREEDEGVVDEGTEEVEAPSQAEKLASALARIEELLSAALTFRRALASLAQSPKRATTRAAQARTRKWGRARRDLARTRLNLAAEIKGLSLKETAIERLTRRVIEVAGEFSRTERHARQLLERFTTAPRSRHSAPQVEAAANQLALLEAQHDCTALEIRRSARQISAARADAEAAKRELTESNLKLAVAFAKRYRRRGLQLQDLIQEANLGLMKAIDKFDWRRGYKFSTYAIWWIRQAITRALADHGRTIRIPVHLIEKLAKIRAATAQLFHELGREPSYEEIAARVDLPPLKVRIILRAAQNPISLETPIGVPGDEARVGDFIEDHQSLNPHDGLVSQVLAERMDDVLATLSPREEQVIRLRFGQGTGREHTLEEVGAYFNLTRERIRQIEAKALKKLRHPSRVRVLKPFIKPND